MSDNRPVIVISEGVPSVLIGVIDHVSPLPAKCNPKNATISLTRSIDNSIVNIAQCWPEQGNMNCSFTDKRYRRLGRELRELRIYDVTTSMAGNYLTTITCNDDRTYQTTTPVHVRGKCELLLVFCVRYPCFIHYPLP